MTTHSERLDQIVAHHRSARSYGGPVKWIKELVKAHNGLTLLEIEIAIGKNITADLIAHNELSSSAIVECMLRQHGFETDGKLWYVPGPKIKTKWRRLRAWLRAA